ncbi:UPF0125 protein RatB [hydrothermal vent metagenome]|uniref:UPF0125 protein RatB n=1 Tax=hydrothermal vent metagenome TaxID=652676 RepID=A0A3B1A7Y2_9ZZZZ
MENKPLINVEVAYALADKQVLIPLMLEEGSTAQQAIESSGVLVQFPTIDLDKNRVGIFGKLSKLNAVLREKDRVEIYRPLIADPKAVRKKRAEEGKAMKKGGATPAA